VVLVPGWTDWLAEISADLWEAVAHVRHVCDDALYKSTVALLYFMPPETARTRHSPTQLDSVLHVSIKQFFMDYKSGPLLWQAPTFSCSNAQPPILCKAGSIHEKFAPVLKKQTELASQVQSEFIISLQQAPILRATIKHCELSRQQSSVCTLWGQHATDKEESPVVVRQVFNKFLRSSRVLIILNIKRFSLCQVLDLEVMNSKF